MTGQSTPALEQFDDERQPDSNESAPKIRATIQSRNKFKPSPSYPARPPQGQRWPWRFNRDGGWRSRRDRGGDRGRGRFGRRGGAAWRTFPEQPAGAIFPSNTPAPQGGERDNRGYEPVVVIRWL